MVSFNSFRFNTLAALLPLAFLALVAGCGGEDGGMGPQVEPTPSHFLVSVKMSSIDARENCENDPGNPGEFRTTLIVRKTDELGNQVEIGRFGPEAMSLNDGDVLGSTMEPIEFLMPRESGAQFQVEYRVGEYDGANTDFENHGWATHIYDRDEEQEWAAGSSYDSYVEQEDGETYGILKFTVWSTRNECKGLAKYIVRWKPVWPDEL